MYRLLFCIITPPLSPEKTALPRFDPKRGLFPLPGRGRPICGPGRILRTSSGRSPLFQRARGPSMTARAVSRSAPREKKLLPEFPAALLLFSPRSGAFFRGTACFLSLLVIIPYYFADFKCGFVNFYSSPYSPYSHPTRLASISSTGISSSPALSHNLTVPYPLPPFQRRLCLFSPSGDS